MDRLAVGVRDAAFMAGVSDRVIRDAIYAQKLPARRTGGPGTRFVIKVADLEAWIDGLEQVR